MISFQGLDVETRPINGAPQEYALMPWRALTKEMELSYCAVVHDFKHGYVYTTEPDGHAYEAGPAQAGVRHALAAQKDAFLVSSDRYTVAWNALFDVACLLTNGASASDLKEINWLDAMLLWKWIESDLLSYSLANAVTRWLDPREYPWLPAYLQMKEREKEEGFDTPNTKVYCRFDAFVTVELARKMWPLLPESQRAAFLIEQECIFTVARSWMVGVPVNTAAARELEPVLAGEMAELEAELGLTAKQLRSPVQLRAILYGLKEALTSDFKNALRAEDAKKLQELTMRMDNATSEERRGWGWPVDYRTDPSNTHLDGQPATDKTALTYGSDHDKRGATILKWRERNTRLTKYVQAPQKAEEYNGRAVTHSAPRLFSTYTGRMTYSSKTLKKFQNGIALHQWCREKKYRKIIEAPPGFELVEFDASGQEMRGMAEFSRDATMLRVFAQGMDAHSYTGAAIAGIDYDEFMQRKAAGEELIVGPKGYRYQGKFTNLSLQYRTGVKTLRRKARIDYGYDADMEEAGHWKATYFNLFPGVKRYWDDAIQRCKMLGYAETLGGRRYYIPAWRFEKDKDSKWAAESSAINFPIQGTGADQKELGIKILAEQFPELMFAFDLHDGLFMWKPKAISSDIILEARDALDNIDYQKYWGYTPSIPLPWDASRASNWGEMEEL